MGAISYGITDLSTKRAVENLQRQIDALERALIALERTVKTSSPKTSIDIDETAIQALQTQLSELANSVETIGGNVSTLQSNKVSLRIANAASFSMNQSNYRTWTFTLASNESIIGVATYNLGDFSGTIGHLSISGNTITVAATTTGSPNHGSLQAIVMKVGA